MNDSIRIEIARRPSDPAPVVPLRPPNWPNIARIFEERADREREIASALRYCGKYGEARKNEIRAETLDQAAAFCRAQPTT